MQGGRPADGCASTTLWTGGLDIPSTSLSVTVTFDGGALPTTTDEEELQLSLVDESTGAIVELRGPQWNEDSQNIEQYDLVAGSASFTQTITPGSYSLLYGRGWSAEAGLYVYATPTTQPLPYGYHLLQQHVVVAAGTQSLPIALPVTTLAVTVTFGGGALPTKTDEEEMSVVLLDESTNATIELAGPQWNEDPQNIEQYDLTPGSGTFTQRILPGTYSVLYQRGWSDDSNLYVYATPSTETLPYGYHLLQQHVTLGAGPQQLAIDVPSTHLQVSVTFDGGALPTITDEEEMQLQLVDESTGATVELAGPQWNEDAQNIEQYDLVPGSSSFSQLLVPGTYSVRYARGWSAESGLYVYATPATETLPYAYHLLQQHVVVSAGSHSLSVDIPATQLQVGVTLNGGALPTTTDEEEMQLQLIDETTGATMELLGPQWTEDAQNIEQYDLVAGSDSFTQVLVPGAYSVRYARGWSTDSELYVYATPASQPLPYGYHLLQQHVALPPGPAAMPVDIPTTALGVGVTLNGGALPTTTDEEEMQLELVDESTGATIGLLGPQWTEDAQNIEQYDLVPGSVPFFQTLVAGRYSVRYARGWSVDSTPIVYATPSTETLPYAYSILQQGVALPEGGAWLPVDIQTTPLPIQVTLAGGALPAHTDEEEMQMLLVDESTGFEIELLGPQWSEDPQNIEQYDFVTGTATFTQQLMNANYTSLYARGWSNDTGLYVYATPTTETLPYAYHQLGTCQQVGP